MKQFLKRRCTSKRECITYVVIFLWTYLGVLSTIYEQNLEDLSVYFLSLTGFVGSFIVGESMRKSKDSSIFLRGKNSQRETVAYLIILFWTIIGTFIIVTSSDMIGAATYFGALTPFVGAFIIGNSYIGDTNVDELPNDGEEPFEQINS